LQLSTAPSGKRLHFIAATRFLTKYILVTPVIPDLVSYAEIAEIAGVSRQRARQFADIEGFPKPVVETAAGPLRLKASVEAWVERRNTKPGRPRKTA